MRIAHVVNPVLVNKYPDLLIAQSVTFRTMVAAKRYSIDDVELRAIIYQGLSFNATALSNHQKFSQQQNLNWEMRKESSQTRVSNRIASEVDGGLSESGRAEWNFKLNDCLVQFGYAKTFDTRCS